MIFFSYMFYTQASGGDFSLESESPHVSRTLLSIQADLNNTVVCMVLIFLLPLSTVPTAPTIIGITVTFMFHSFFCTSASSKYLSIFSLFSFSLCGLLE